MAEHGTVKWYSIAKGYGFIVAESDGRDIFVHYTALADRDAPPPAEGEKVSYEREDHEKGPRALSVRRRED